MSDLYDVIVIGSGPAGYPAAIRAAQNKLKVACIDEWKNTDGSFAFGGTCLNAGCIPSKALLESSELYQRAKDEFAVHGIKIGGLALDLTAMQKRRASVVKTMTGGIAALFKANGVTGIQGHGRLLPGNKVLVTGPDGAEKTFEAKHVVLASGSVTVLEALEQFLPIADGAIAKEALRHFKKQGLDIKLGAKVQSAAAAGGAVDVVYTDAQGEHKLQVDKLVVAVGRKPFTQGLLAEGTGVALDERGFIQVDEHCRTGVPNVWAVGDVVRGPMLAHKGKEEGVMVADLIAGHFGEMNYKVIPSVIYTAPEIAWVGLTEEEVKASGRPYKVGTFPFSASGRARAMEAAQGLAKIVSAKDDDEVLGVHVIGPMAGELISEAVLAMEYSASTEDIQRTIHAHPTLSEAIHEAALAVDKKAIDGINR